MSHICIDVYTRIKCSLTIAKITLEDPLYTQDLNGSKLKAEGLLFYPLFGLYPYPSAVESGQH